MGKQQFYVPSTIQAVPSKKLNFYREDFTTVLNAGEQELHYFYANTEEYNTMVSLECVFNEITEATSGIKRIYAYTNGGQLDEIQLNGDYNSRLAIEGNSFKNFTGSEPSKDVVAKLIKGGLRFTEDVALLIKFFNESDANTSAKRSIVMTTESEVVNT